MRYLCFHPKQALNSNNKWSTHHQHISSLLHHCSKKQELMQIHAHLIRTQLIQDTFLVSRILAFLVANCSPSNMAYARQLFDQIPHPNPFVWNSMIRGYTCIGAPRDGLLMYKLMLLRGFPPDSHTCSIITRACAQLKDLRLGAVSHGSVLKCGFGADMFVMSGFVKFYSDCGEIRSAREIFEGMHERDVVSWTSMVAGYAQLNRWDEALVLLREMKAAGGEPNRVTVMSLLSVCGQSRDLDRGRWIHSRMVGNEMAYDVAVCNALVSMYAKCGSVCEAIDMFKNMKVRNKVTWNGLIGGFVQSGFYTEALTMFQDMLRLNELPDEMTIVSALSACAQLSDIKQGRLLHVYIQDNEIVRDVFVNNALISMYAKCGDLEKAEQIFLEMPEKDVFSWTAMISGYAQGNRCQEALNLFEDMWLSNVKANEVTLVSVLSACAQLGALDQGKRIHAYIEENKMRKDVTLRNSLVDMYAKCGCIEIASQLFYEMPHKSTLSWNAMIGGLAAHGRGSEAIELFKLMERIGDAKPDHITLLAVLSACSHSGMVHEGFRYLNSMSEAYDIAPGVEHYGCIVDLLGRAGLLLEAVDFIREIPIEANSVIWGSLLASCRVCRKVELAEEVAQHIIELAPENDGAHVLISNLYAETGRWEDVTRVRTMMGRKGIEKSPGYSSVEVDGVVHEFLVGDKSLQQNHLILLVLNSLVLHLRQAFWANESTSLMLQCS